MSATTQKPIGELSQPAPAFSYAQAAKGVYPSIPSPGDSSKALSESAGTNPRRTSIPDPKSTSMASDRPVAKRTASEGRESRGGELENAIEPAAVPSNDPETVTLKAAPTGQSQSGGPDRAATSTPSSPGFGTASTSTLPKEDDLFSTPNGSSDSTWEKQSQTSQNGIKNGEKADAEKEQNADNTWDEEPQPPVSLKEAPPPAINFWQQRIEAQDAKAKALKQANPVQKPKPITSNAGHGSMNGVPKSLDSGIDSRKQDTKKKTKGNSGLPDERTASGTARENIKPAEGRTRNWDEGSFIILYFICSKALTDYRQHASVYTIARSREAYICSDSPASASWGCYVLANARQRARRREEEGP